MQKVIQHMMGYLKKDLSREDSACLGQVGATGPHRGLPAGAGAADPAADAAEAPLEPLRGARVGAPADLSESVPRGADAAGSCVGLAFASHLPGILCPRVTVNGRQRDVRCDKRKLVLETQT